MKISEQINHIQQNWASADRDDVLVLLGEIDRLRKLCLKSNALCVSCSVRDKCDESFCELKKKIYGDFEM